MGALTLSEIKKKYAKTPKTLAEIKEKYYNPDKQKQSAQDHLQSVISSASRYYQSAANRYDDLGVEAFSETGKRTMTGLNRISDDVESARMYLDRNRDILGADYADAVEQALSMLRDDKKTVYSAYSSKEKAYSGFHTQKEFDDAVAQYEYDQKMTSYDMNAAEQEISEWNQAATDYSRYAAMNSLEGNAAIAELDKKYGGIGNLYNLIDSKNAEIREVKKYQADRETALKAQEENQQLLSMDLDSAQKELDELNAIIAEYNKIKLLPGSQVGDASRAFVAKYGQPEDIKNTIAEKEAALNRAKYLQEGVAMASVSDPASENYDPEFKRYSNYAQTGDLTYEYINGGSRLYDGYVIGGETVRDEIQNQAALGSTTAKDVVASNYGQMTDDEISTYNYYYAKYGKEKADDYLSHIAETLNSRAAAQAFEPLKDNTALELLFGAVAGVDQFDSGLKNLLNFQDDYIPASSIQMTSAMVRDDLWDAGPELPEWMGGSSLGQAAYDTVTTTANMAPSIITSTVVGMINPVAGKITGVALMGGSAAGNAYQEALNMGYTKGQARTYSTLVGASEAGLEYIIGGISALGGTLTNNTIQKILSGVDNAFGRIAINLGGSMLSEGFEEGLQEILTPVFKNWSMRLDEDINWDDVWYSAFLGAVTGGLLESVDAVSPEVSAYQTGKQLQSAGVSADRLASIGKTFSADTVAYKLAGKIDSNTNAYTMGRLLNAIDAEITEQNKADLQNYLVGRYVDSETARLIVDAFAGVVVGDSMNAVQVAAIAAEKDLADAVREVIYNKNTTFYQRSAGYRDVLMDLAKETVSRKAQKAQSTAKENKQSSVPENSEKTAQVNQKDEEPKIKRIKSIQDGVMVLEMDDGSEVNAEDAVYSDEATALVYETVARMGIDAESANMLVNAFEQGGKLDAQVYNLGIQEAFRFGQYNYPMEQAAKGPFTSMLSEAQRNTAYKLGQIHSDKTTQAAQAKITEKKSAAQILSGKEKGKVHYDRSIETYTGKQQADLSAMEVIAESTGVQIYVFESYEKDGKRMYKDEKGTEKTAPNGYYDPLTNSIHIDLYAGNNGEGVMMFTLAHELTHFIRQWSPAKFKVLADFLVQEYGKKGVSLDELVRAQMSKAQNNGRTISYDTAYEEMIADSMETMLSDGAVLRRLKQKDETLWEKIKTHINRIAKKLRHSYKGMDPQTAEGQIVSEMVDAVEKLRELFTEGLVEASENSQTSGQVLASAGIAVDSETDSGSLLSVRDVLNESDRRKVAKQTKDAEVAKQMPKVIERITNEIIKPEYNVSELADADTKFSIRNEAPPKKTGIAYKVFLAKDGGLYPPMVANPNGEATPVGVWLNADIGKMAPPSKTGRPQVQSGGKGTNVGKGSLAFRPGWHLGDIPQATQFAKLNPETGKKELFPANFVWAECEYAMDVDYQEEAMSYGYTENGKFRHSYAGLPKLPTDGYYRYRTNPNPDTVPWVITGAMRVNRILTDAETDAICRANGVEPMARQGGPINLEDFGLSEDNLLYSDRYWKPKLNKSEWSLLNRELNRQIETTDNYLDPATKWLYAKEKGTEVFAIYGIGDGTEPTPLYATGGNKANLDHKYLQDLMEGYDNGSDRGRAAFDRRVETLLAKQRRSYPHLYDAARERATDRDAGVYVPKREGYWRGNQGTGEENSGKGIKLSDRDTNPVSTRHLLVNALESAAQTEAERIQLKKYRKNIEKMNEEDALLRDLNRQIKELSFAKGPRDKQKISELRNEAIKVGNRISIYDQRLLRMEASTPLRNVLERKKKAAYQKAKELGNKALDKYKSKAIEEQERLKKRYRENVQGRKNTAMRHKIQGVVKTLDNMLRKETKDKHIPDSLKKTVAIALDMVNMDTVVADEQIAKLQKKLADAKNADEKAEISRKIYRMLERGEKMSEHLEALKSAYEEYADTNDGVDEVILGIISYTRDFVGETPIRNMTYDQLEAVYEMYTAVLEHVRKANESFATAKKERIADLGKKVMREVSIAGGKRLARIKALERLEQFSWDNEKPVYAFKRIGSDTLSLLFENIRHGEDVWARDTVEAADFSMAQRKKYGYESWDHKKQFEFTDASGKAFSLNLEQIFSLYAYSRRNQAEGHLFKGGFVFDPKTEIYKVKKVLGKIEVEQVYNVSGSEAYVLNPDILSDIIGVLNDNQKHFVEDMQEYLSTNMADKGNEISQAMYGIKLFKEKFYFPLKSDKAFMEAEKQKAVGDIKVKNKGFTKETVKNASNPVVLSGFMDVWSNHVSEMSMYHGFTLPLEDFYRVRNFKDSVNTGVTPTISDAYGSSAIRYIDQLLKDLNGGVLTDPRETFAKAFMRLSFRLYTQHGMTMRMKHTPKSICPA